ncbi:ScyD/ScyE family protein [Microbacterium sp. NPDC089318]
MRTSRALAAVGAAAALILVVPTAASAADRTPVLEEWSAQLAAPFSLAVEGHRVLVADGGTGVVGQLQPDGSIAPVVEGVPGLAGLAVRGAWMAYGSSVEDGASEPPVITESGLNVRRPGGQTTYIDLHAYEVANNPDADNSYGVTDPASCAAGTEYTGLLDSHVYGVAAWHSGWLVADAASNAVYEVTAKGAVRTLAVLPPVPVTLTAETTQMLGLDECAIGDVYYAEPVPTGVAVGPGGAIYVTTLPGFPGESASLGALWRIDSRSGSMTQVASGFSGPTSLAIAANRVYIAELFGGQISVVDRGTATPFAALPGAVGVAASGNGTVWASTLDLAGGPGTLVSIAKGKVKVQAHIRR